MPLYERLARALHHTALFLTDAEGRITSWNPGVEELLGYTEAEWVGQPGSIIFTPEDIANEVFVKEMQEAARAGEAAQVRWHQRKDSSIILVDSVLAATRDDAGAIEGFCKMLRAATEVKTAVEALRRSEERLRFAQEGAGLGIWDWDIPSDTITRSLTHYRLFGQEPQEGTESYAEWLSHLHPEDQGRVDAEIRRALQTGEMDSEFRVIWPNGDIHWMHTRGRVYFEQQEPRRMIRVVRDITPQKVTEQALADSEARKSAILNASLDAVLVMDGEGLLREFNPAAEQMFGYERGQAIGQSLADLIVPPHLREAHRRGLANYLATGQACVLGKRIEIDAMRKGGSAFPVELAILRVPVEGAPIFAGYVRDITERKHIEEQLRRSNEELGDFAHVVSHDLQTPLRTVQAYTQLLATRFGGELDSGASEIVSHIHSGTQTMNVLIQGLLQYATAGQEAPRVPVPLNEVVPNVTGVLAAAIAEAGAEVIYSDLPVVAANAVQMQQLFQNLIGNALKYAVPGVPPRVRIRSEFADNRWWISIADNGQGIAPEQHERIFRPLSRLHGSEIPGTGLGLAVCKKIVERLGGVIWVESEPGKGATFRFSLPAATLLKACPR
ncbi:MAG TPA: PAS domain S-box protein [Bryobacteraceae bacterium]|nr:PAS domain S-box protein [Bryobacteraceae bacterium]